MARQITDASFPAEVTNTKGLVLVDFWAPWCGPCRQLGPILDELSEDMKDKVTILKMNIDENLDTPAKLGVRSIPALFLFQDGKQIATRVGSSPKSALIEWINSEAA